MSDTPVELDLKFLPDWLKETPAGNRYADFQGEREDRPGRRDDGQRGSRGPRPGQPRGGAPGQPRGAGRPGEDRRGPRRDGPPRGGRQGGAGGGGPRGDRREEVRRAPVEVARGPVVPAGVVRIEFLPEPNGSAGIARQIRSGTRAYPLFGTARLFLEKPERHRVRIISQDESLPLFQCGDGPVSFDRAAVERGAFQALREQYYKEEVVESEPLKGNFRNVARCRSTGTLIGPTNYHSYQPTLRKIYEERFSRRMSFAEFQHHEIETVTDEQAVADWKEQARRTVTYVSLKEAEPLTFKSAMEAEQHFRKVYLPQLVTSAQSFEVSGPASRAGGDRAIGAALRDAWEREKQYPQSLVNGLRPAFQEAGLHYFKHRKRTLFVSPIRPQRAPKGQVFSTDIAAILSAIEAAPKCTRRDLAVRILGEQHEAPEAAPRKSALASDLHYLVQAGHVIEFYDGTLDLPLVPGEKPETERPEKAAPAAQAGGPVDAAQEVAVPVAEEAGVQEALPVESEPEAENEMAAVNEPAVESEQAIGSEPVAAPLAGEASQAPATAVSEAPEDSKE